ncbi:histone H4 transcription factor-like [Oscarella lobularis]|uniref:histone H4 transcription factor-like n=1 Tax=Oscarella lobularis TaxID=121494 RepID=UPI0033132AB1
MSLACEWDDCTTKCDTRDALCAHVREHSRHLYPNWPPPSDESLHAYPGETMGCLWKDCPYETDSPLQLLLHVSFHPYHAYIKEEGRRVQAKENLTVCSYGDETRNLVPPIGEVLVCDWRDCGEQFYCPNSFYSHVEEHGLKAPRDQTEDGKSILKCLCKDCNSVAKDKHKLKGHCTVHTHKKVRL